MGNYKDPDAVEAIRALALAGASIRQVATTCGISQNTARRYLLEFRSTIKCEHGGLKYLCRSCNYRRVADPGSLRKALRNRRDAWWTVFYRRTDGKVCTYRMVRAEKVAREECDLLKTSDPRCEIEDAWFTRFDPDAAHGA